MCVWVRLRWFMREKLNQRTAIRMEVYSGQPDARPAEACSHCHKSRITSVGDCRHPGSGKQSSRNYSGEHRHSPVRVSKKDFFCSRPRIALLRLRERQVSQQVGQTARRPTSIEAFSAKDPEVDRWDWGPLSKNAAPKRPPGVFFTYGTPHEGGISVG